MTDSDLLKNLGRVCHKFPHANLPEALSTGQVDSKIWLVNELSNLGFQNCKVWVLAGWYGVLSYLLLSQGIAHTIYQFDIDDNANKIADTLCQNYVKNNWQFKAVLGDIYELDYTAWSFIAQKSDGSWSRPLKEEPDLIVNTSCEHICFWSNWWDKVPEGKVLALQSNNFHKHPDHCNTQSSLTEWLNTLNMRKVYFSGTLHLNGYERYMVIGKK
jgi:hypothetical protein